MARIPVGRRLTRWRGVAFVLIAMVACGLVAGLQGPAADLRQIEPSDQSLARAQRMMRAPLDSVTDSYPDGAATCRVGEDSNRCDETYDWGYKTGAVWKINSDRGYGYRNCTDWVAFRASQFGVAVSKSLGNGGEWAKRSPATAVRSTPVPGMAAVIPVSDNDQYGHVAFVEAVYDDGQITVTEFNWKAPGLGSNWTGRPAERGFAAFVDLGIDPELVSALNGVAGNGAGRLQQVVNSPSGWSAYDVSQGRVFQGAPAVFADSRQVNV